MAGKIAANGPLGVGAIRRVANESVGMTLVDDTRLESQLFGDCVDTWDQKEGMSAFVEKRKHEPYTGK